MKGFRIQELQPERPHNPFMASVVEGTKKPWRIEESTYPLDAVSVFDPI